MKKVVFYFSLIVLGTGLIYSCKENHTLVILGGNNSVAKDTTYVLPEAQVPAADPHNVLFEDFTGVTCSNCPVAHDGILAPLDHANPHRLNIIELFCWDVSNAVPNSGQHSDFRDSIATAIEDNIYQTLLGVPMGGVDRMPLGNGVTPSPFQLLSPYWHDAVDSQLTRRDSLNLSLTSVFDSTSRTVTITTIITYVQPVSIPQNLSIALVEDSLVDFQLFSTGVDSNYRFDGVFRDFITASPFGDPVFVTIPAKERGRVCQKIYTYHLKKTSWIAKNCRLIAFVSNDGAHGGTHVYQSVQTKLAQ